MGGIVLLGSDEYKALREHLFRLETDQRKILTIVEDRVMSADERESAIHGAIASMQTHMKVIAESIATSRVRAMTPLAATVPASQNGRNPDDTHTDLTAQAQASSAIGGEPWQVTNAILGTLTMWKRRPHLVLGAVGAISAVAISFGWANITAVQQGFIGAAILAICALFADQRSERTLKKSVAVAAATPTNAHPSERPPAE